MHLYITVMKYFGEYIRTAGTCELKGIRHYIDYSQVSLTTMETSARMLREIRTYGVH